MGKTSTIIISDFEFSSASEGIWRNAKVPGTVHQDLLAYHLIPDPYIGENEKLVQWVERETWLYRAKFDCGSLNAFEYAELVLSGVDTHSEVYIDGKIVLTTQNMFRPSLLPITGGWRNGVHELLIVFHPASVHDSLAAMAYKTRLPDNRTFSRKPGYQYGWDWGPRLITCGITAPVKIHGWNELKLISARVITRKIESDRAFINAILEVSADQEMIMTLKCIESKAGISETIKVRLDVGHNEIRIPFEISNPKLWWPNGYGKPFLYHLVVESDLFDSAVEVPFGVRMVELVQEPDSSGVSFLFRINGKPVFAKGANYIPQDNFITRPDDLKYRQLLSRAAGQGFNMLRVWGGGIYERDLFYNLCDSLGLMVWQDFMFACYFPPATPQMAEEVRLEAIWQVKRLRPHPSVVLWCGNNEIDEAWHNWGYQKVFGYTKADSLKVWGDYKRLFDTILPDVLAQNDTTRPWWPSSPSIGWGRKESLRYGDMHYWGVWWGNEPFEIYRKKTGRFMSEYGFQSYPHPSTISYWAGERNKLSFSHPLMKAHQKHATGGETIETYLKRDFNLPADFDQYIYLSQVLQARGMGFAVESHRLAMPRCMGTLYWQLNDCWPVTSWSSVDYFGRPKAFFYQTSRLFAPTLITASVRLDTLWIEAVTEADLTRELELTVRVISLDGETIHTINEKVNLDRDHGCVLMKKALRELMTDTDKNDVFITAVLSSAGSGDIARCRTTLCRPADLVLRDPKVSYTLMTVGDHIHELKVMSEYPAFDVFIRFENDSEAVFSDNFFDLMPERPEIIRIESNKSISDLHEGLKVRSWYGSSDAKNKLPAR
ncbi:MAG: hypothetical protein A2X11_16220 [Bacteroidetes bacterium GWE2_42_24]|nr:MAG: hypothetical protein A2X11_16220 [Bacteroidetes bacterium GWE2_42_24]OFY29318.1 MAG: hypothetical protein A2X09_05615 [Bacteroidetes bacterium GWF2_43_11]